MSLRPRHISNFRFIQTEVSSTSFGTIVYSRCSAADVNVLGYAFRADGRYFVLAERHKSKDTLGLYDTAELFKLVRVCSERLSDMPSLMWEGKHFPLPTASLSALALSPSGNNLAVWEGPLEVSQSLITRGIFAYLRFLQYKLYIVSLAGDVQGSFIPDPDPGFGIRSAVWHPSGLFLAVGGWDDKVCIALVPWMI